MISFLSDLNVSREYPQWRSIFSSIDIDCSGQQGQFFVNHLGVSGKSVTKTDPDEVVNGLAISLSQDIFYELRGDISKEQGRGIKTSNNLRKPQGRYSSKTPSVTPLISRRGTRDHANRLHPYKP